MDHKVGTVIGVLFLALAIETKVTPKLLGHFSASHASFVGISRDKNQSDVRDQYSLTIAGYNSIPFTSDYVYQVKKIGRHLDHVWVIRPTIVTSEITWPNEVNAVSPSIFNKEMISIAGGFLVPLKTHGSISLYDTSTNPPKGPYYITNNYGSDASWFYHRIVWKDMDGDGDMDVLTCRAEKPIIGSTKGQLLWFENPGRPTSQEFRNPWTAHVISNGPDVYFRAETLSTPSGEMDAIITAGLFSEKIQIFWTTEPSKKWTVASHLHSRVIENGIGAVFDIELVDLNNDGKKDLLVTTNKQNNAALYVYEFPDDFRTETFRQHVLEAGFKASFSLFGRSGALGSAYAIHEPVSSNKRPIIIMSGADDGKAYILESRSESHSDWHYTNTAFLTTGSDTVGEIAHADVNGDGHTEIFVPDYNKGLVYVYTLTST